MYNNFVTTKLMREKCDTYSIDFSKVRSQSQRYYETSYTILKDNFKKN